MLWIMDAVLVEEQAINQCAKLKQRVPIATVTSEARSFDGEDSPSASCADRRQKSLEPGADAAASRTTQSSSMTTTFDQPRAFARAASPYWRRRLSGLLAT